MRLGKFIRGDEVEYALLDPALFQAPLFSSFARGERPAGPTFKFDREQHSFTLACWQGLDTRDQSILFAVVGMAGIQSVEVTSTTRLPIDDHLWFGVDGVGNRINYEGLLLDTTKYALLKAARHATRDDDYSRLKDSLFRLSMVGYRIQAGGYDSQQTLIRFVGTDDERIVILLCRRLADAVLRGQHIRMSLKARGLLKGDVAKLLHASLSSMTRQGSRGVWMGIGTLGSKVWGNEASIQSTERTRRASLHKALGELELIGWTIERQGSGSRLKVRMRRPRDC